MREFDDLAIRFRTDQIATIVCFAATSHLIVVLLGIDWNSHFREHDILS